MIQKIKCFFGFHFWTRELWAMEYKNNRCLHCNERDFSKAENKKYPLWVLEKYK